jgi:TnpA family transposase
MEALKSHNQSQLRSAALEHLSSRMNLAACACIANATLAIRNTAIWGDAGTACASPRSLEHDDRMACPTWRAWGDDVLAYQKEHDLFATQALLIVGSSFND